jgi:selenocysteine-specific elongation factor
LTVAWFSGFSGLEAADLVREANIAPSDAAELIGQLQARGDLVEIAAGHSKRLLLHKDMAKELEDRILEILRRLHAQFPLMSAHDRQKVQSQLDYVGDDALVHATVDRLIQTRRLTGDLRRVARADFKPQLSGSQRKLRDKLIAAYREARFQPPEPASFTGAAGGNAASLKDLYEVCVAEGFLVQVNDDTYLHADVETEMRRLIADKLSAGRGLTVAEIRDLLGTTRKYAVPLCEYLDRIGLTHREGDLRVLATAPSPASAPSGTPQ